MAAPQQALLMTYGGGLVNITNQSSVDSAPFPSAATAGYRLSSTGAASKIVSDVYTLIANQWLVLGAAADYEARATLDSGDALTTGTVGTWQSLGTTRTYEQSSTSGTKESFLTIEIRLASTGTVLKSASVHLIADSS